MACHDPDSSVRKVVARFAFRMEVEMDPRLVGLTGRTLTSWSGHVF